MGKKIAGFSSVSFAATAEMGGLWSNLFFLLLNLWYGSWCNRPSFEFEPLVANGIMQWGYGSGGKLMMLPLKSRGRG